MNTPPVLEVHNLSKKFCRALKRQILYSLRDIAFSFINIPPHVAPLRAGEFYALRHLSFSVRPGEIVGITGPNGCGKTTLLKCIAQIVNIDDGTITRTGPCTPILTPRGGFHAATSVEQNMHFYASILGMTRQHYKKKYEWIREFSGITPFLAAPAGSLSQGTAMRLGFALALATDASIYCVDEVLATGDASFRERAVAAMKQVATRAAVCIVSHNRAFLSSFCTRHIEMDKGRIVSDTAMGEGDS